MGNAFKLCAFADEASPELSGQIEALRGNGIGLLEIRGVDGRNISKLTPEDARCCREALNAGGISVWSIGSPVGKAELSADFAPQTDDFKRMLEIAGILGARRFRMFSFYGVSGAAARDTVMERLELLVNAAKGSGVMLCHENEKGIYGESAAACLDIHKSVPGLRAVFDPANFAQAGQNVPEAWDMLSDYVEYLHIKDALEDGFVVPSGHGICGVAELIEKFGAKGGTVLSIEPHLKVFKGLSELEKDARTAAGPFEYPSGRAAFDAAAAALKALIH